MIRVQGLGFGDQGFGVWDLRFMVFATAVRANLRALAPARNQVPTVVWPLPHT